MSEYRPADGDLHRDLTRVHYNFPMSHSLVNRRFYAALGVALAVHAALMLLPFQKQQAHPAKAAGLLKVHLAALPAKAARAEELHLDPKPLAAAQAPPAAIEPMPPAPRAAVPPVASKPEPNRVEGPEPERLRHSILASQFLGGRQEDNASFSLAPRQKNPEVQTEFHLPHRASMYEVMMPPLPDLPFAHQPGFVEFSYTAPGFLGELQYFFDVITPEFEFKTKHGTRVKCALILVIAGCAWD